MKLFFFSMENQNKQPDCQYFKLIYAKLINPKAFISRNGNKAKRMCWLKKELLWAQTKHSVSVNAGLLTITKDYTSLVIK